MKNALIGAGLAVAAMTGSAAAEEVLGKQEYMVACAICHGESGKGNGPFAPVLNIETPSLTNLAAKNDGTFPFLETLMIIDGRTGVRGHDGGSMPIWGDRYSKSATELAGVYGSEAIVRGRLLSLVYYLESIQE
ncbi:c-type cytochrome [Marimonas arenosa]|uniref:Cytochrome c n=1 Tax=Marimonas arenosa TaxID=1795305 RepID=A0AAE4B312_9RHOB|nr:c-type cytochrome [Marimonas arenosa]MDQ2089553.1 cytochrome c [Marimonas arenosa]